MADVQRTETEEERKRRLNFTADVCRSGLFASSQDILAEMMKAGMPQAGVSMMTGAAMFTAEIVHNTISQAGGDLGKARKWLLDSVAAYFDGYAQAAVKEAASRIISDAPGVQ